MKRFFFTLVALSTTIGFAHADGKKGGGSAGGGKSISSSSVGKSLGTKTIDSNAVKKVGDLGGKTQALDKKIGGLDNKVGKGLTDKNIAKTLGNGQNGKLNGKFELQGNKNVAKLPGFKSNPQQHVQFCGKYGVPKALHNHCFFHFDFCWNHCCWLPSYNCCGYWHPYQCCWYYYHPTWCCYVPCSYIETYSPVIAVEQTPVIVNVTNTNTNVNNDTPDPLAVAPSLPPGAAATLPAGVNPNIPAPKQ